MSATVRTVTLHFEQISASANLAANDDHSPSPSLQSQTIRCHISISAPPQPQDQPNTWHHISLAIRFRFLALLPAKRGLGDTTNFRLKHVRNKGACPERRKQQIRYDVHGMRC